MTRIRRINVSQVEGDGADNTSIDEIRPFGETGFYLDNNNKLTLMMFDGVRTHQDSKVLSPGVLWGSNADAGDGSSADTIKLIPDAGLFANGSDQYIVVDPTGGEPGHIHLRAGGVQDSSSADLYIGGEQTFVRVSDTNDNVVIRTSVLGEGITPYTWLFDNTGKTTFPGGMAITGIGATVQANTGNDINIETNDLQSVSAVCAPRGSGNNFVADTTDNDDITVVQEGWTVDIDGTTYTVTTVMGGIGEFDIFATGATFVPGTTYTFTNPMPVTKTWSFGSTGILTTPGLGTISHAANDLIVEVTGTDVIVLRTVGGDFMMAANGDITVPGNINSSNSIEVAAGDTVSIVTNNTVAAKTWLFDEAGDLTVPGGVKTILNNSLSIGTESLPTDPPATIVISGADFSSVNLTYTKDGANSIWYPAGYILGTDPYIEFTGGQYGIFVPGFGQPLYVNTGTLNIPLAQWNTNPPLGSVAPTGVYTYPGTYTHAWTFGIDGSLSVPGSIKNTQTLGGSVVIATASIQGDTAKTWTFSHDGVGDLSLPKESGVSAVKSMNLSTYSPTFQQFVNLKDYDSLSSVDGTDINIINPQPEILALIDPTSPNFIGTAGAKVRIVHGYSLGDFIVTETTLTGPFALNGEDPLIPGVPRYTATIADTGVTASEIRQFGFGDSATWHFKSSGELRFPDNTVQTTAAAPYGQYDHLIDGTNTLYTVPSVTMSLLNVAPAIGYAGNDTHTVILPIGQPGQRLLITNQSALCTLSIGGAVETPYAMAVSSLAEFVFVAGIHGDGWRALYGTV